MTVLFEVLRSFSNKTDQLGLNTLYIVLDVLNLFYHYDHFEIWKFSGRNRHH